jgi:hypothetical protein
MTYPDFEPDDPFEGVTVTGDGVAVISDGLDAEGISSVTVSVTINAKALGADAFVKLEETFEFAAPVSPVVATETRAELLAALRTQAIDEARKTADAYRDAVASTPRGAVSVVPATPVAGPVNAGAQAGSTAPRFGAAATVAVANGAAPVSGEWGSVPSRFGDGDLRFLTTAAFSTQQLEGEVAAWLTGQGFNPDAFKVWDNRPGPKGLEAGVPNGCVATVKISRDAESFVNGDVARQAIARVKFNSNGSLYIWLTKEAESAVKYGVLDALKGGGDDQ